MAPTLRAVAEQLVADVPVIGGGLLPKHADETDPRWAWADRALVHVDALCQGDRERFDAAIESFAVTSLDFLRLQARFRKTGRYAASEASEFRELYDDAEEMIGYLDGLALSYAMWPNHASMVGFFVDAFVADLPDDVSVMEIGPGHGLFASLLAERKSALDYVGVDISERSLDYTKRSLDAANVSPDRHRLVCADAASDAFEALVGQDAFDTVICCEVLEHVDEPRDLLRAIHKRLRPDGHAFLSTVANLEAVDHVYLYDDLDHIHAHFAETGFEVVAEQPLALPGAENEQPLPLNYSAVVRRA